MTNFAANPSFAPANVRSGQGAGALSLLRRLLRALQAHEDRVHLHALSDHMLNDMGFLRDQIDDVLRGSVRR